MPKIVDKLTENELKIEQAVRRQLIKAYTAMLMFENKYRFHLDYWLRKYQQNLILEMESFFSDKVV